MTRIDPRARILAAVVLVCGIVSCTQWLELAAVSVVGLGLLLISGRSWRQCGRSLLAMDGMALLAVALLPMTVPGDVWLQWGDWSLTRPGLEKAGLILLRANAAAMVMMALIGSMDAVTLGHALARLGMPPKMVHLFLFTVRYLDVLGQEYQRLCLAMRARAFRFGCNMHSWQMIGYLFGMLLVRSLERSQRILAAMRCRGFDGHFPHLDDAGPWRQADGVVVLTSIAGALLLVLQQW